MHRSGVGTHKTENMKEIEKYLMNGLRFGYQQNTVLRTEYNDNSKKIIEYLLTVNVAQQLIEWNEKEAHWSYAINLEYDVEEFLKNAFLPYRITGGLFDSEIISPGIKDFLKKEKEKKKKKEDTEFRYGRIDIGISQENIEFSGYKESISGVELKGINPTTDSVIKDIERLIKSMELSDKDFDNSIQECYCLHIKKLGGDKSLSKEEVLKNAKKKSLNNLEKNIRDNIDFGSKDIDIKIISDDTDNFEFKSVKDFKNHPFINDITTYEVGLETKIVYGVIIKIYRKE